MKSSSADVDEWWEQKQRRIGSGRPVAIEVFLRSFAPPIGAKQRQDTVVEELRRLEDSGEIDAVNVTIWGDAVCPDGCCAETPAGREILDRMSELQQWSADESDGVETTFEETRVSSSVTDETFRKIVPPRITLGVYSRGEVVLVLPCKVGPESLCVDDFLTAFERSEQVRRGIESSA